MRYVVMPMSLSDGWQFRTDSLAVVTLMVMCGLYGYDLHRRQELVFTGRRVY